MDVELSGYVTKMWWNDREIVGSAKGGYSDTGGKRVFNFTLGPTLVQQTDTMIHVAFNNSIYADVHYILFSGLSGHYQYVVNQNLGYQGEVRSLYRFDPLQFTWGRTNIKNAPLPTIQDIQAGYKVQDETWQRPNGSYITKYDFSCYVRGLDFHGVYGDDIGAYVIAPGKDYYIGDHLKQELMVHRESSTNDAVLLHMYHGSHYNSEFSNFIPTGKMWGPWLMYVNDGNLDDAAEQSKKEEAAWPYSWLKDVNYRQRGVVRGRLVLSDRRPAAGAAVFLGDENGAETNNQGSNYQYTTYADADGSFVLDHVRREKPYRLLAWANGGALADVESVHNGTAVAFDYGTNSDVDLGTVVWEVPTNRTAAWRIGDFDRKTLGFRLGGAPMEHGLSDACPANLVYAIGFSEPADWCFAQSAQGNWTVIFPPADDEVKARGAVLSLSLAGYTSQNGYGLGRDSYDFPEVTPTGLNVSMNQQLVGIVTSENATDGALYRSATTSGGYYAQQFTIPAEMFLSDKANRLDLTLTQNHRWRGIMWDALKLEWL
ncbi:polysaccharide lyase family 4 protein [Hypomontagnella monticulosa]|nr:polysaccharide lyase family 4 protein [Hypomontagnella monticulosa]